MTNALGGVENGDAKHMLAPTATANNNGYGLIPIVTADCMAIGAKSMAVAVLLIKSVRIEVPK